MTLKNDFQNAGPGVAEEDSTVPASWINAVATAINEGVDVGPIVVDDITDATAIGKALVKAANTAAARTAIGAVDAATAQNRANHTGQQTSATISDLTEAIQDAVGAFLAQGTNVTLTYDDAANSLTVAAPGAGAGLDAEAVRDAIGIAMVGVGNISVVVNDGADTITISTAATVNSTDAALRDRSTHTGTQSADTVTDGTTNKAYTATEKTKLAAVAAGATANATDAQLRDRATHTGTQSADTIVDGTTNHVFTALDDTKLGSVALGATANSADATLLNRANHTGTQEAATISDFQDAVLAVAGSGDSSSAPSGPVAVAVGTGVGIDLVASSTAGTGRAPFQATVACTDLQFGFCNWRPLNATAVETDGAGDVVISMSIEVGGVIRPLMFNGVRQVTISAGATVFCDPATVLLAAGEFFYVRTRIVSGTYYPPRIAYVAGMGGWTAGATDLTAAGAAAIADATFFTAIAAPHLIIGRSLSPSLAVFGDSIGYGSSDGIGNGLGAGVHTTNEKHGQHGWLGRACIDGGVGMINMAAPSDKVENYLSNRIRRGNLAQYAQTVLTEYPGNDISGSRTLAQIQADMITMWRENSLRGKRVFANCAFPRSTSTDGWYTTASQTATQNPTKRNDYNDWIRDGAPMVAGVAVATGSNIGVADRCAFFDGNTEVTPAFGNHLLYGTFDQVTPVETALNSNIWKAPLNARNVSDAATTAASATVTSATGGFTSADVGRQVTIVGAGASGALFAGYIKSVTNGTTVVMSGNVNTTVSGAVMRIGDHYTTDGIHPHHTACVAAAAKVPTGHFI
ncbi:hypothetical protein [Mycobacterium sp. NPDC050041]|uniref:hypothetical protein n=1 Tax=Mycobacterium sp. NPDC050041 TaxID=3364293 RepID=UPI003C2AC5C3